jgi:hypothetical protein
MDHGWTTIRPWYVSGLVVAWAGIVMGLSGHGIGWARAVLGWAGLSWAEHGLRCARTGYDLSWEWALLRCE